MAQPQQKKTARAIRSHKDPSLEYFLVEKLGEGSQAQIFYAKLKPRNDASQTLDRVAVRVTPCATLLNKDSEKSSKAQDRFVEEQTAFDKINSPFVAKQIELIVSDNNWYSVMEFCNGGTLLDLIGMRGYLHEQEAWYIMKQILWGMKSLVDNKYVHRDLKADNILLHFPANGNNRIPKKTLFSMY